MKGYTQLTQEQRYHIETSLKAGRNQTEIAQELGVHKSTVSREVRRNRGQRGYRSGQAQHIADERQRERNCRPRISDAAWTVAKFLLTRAWSPQQISGHLSLGTQLRVSHEWIYQQVIADRKAGGTLYTHLRCQKRRRKRHGVPDRRGQLVNRRSIDDRPSIVEERARIGDWEADTIVGAGHQQALVSLVERRSKYTVLRKVERATAEAVKTAMIKLLQELGDGQMIHTITSDNGREFARHEEIAKTLDIDFFFAHPYSSWERGLNENTNGLVRQYFPKGSSFVGITDQDVEAVMTALNHRPRRALGYLTPHQVYIGQADVALRS